MQCVLSAALQLDTYKTIAVATQREKRKNRGFKHGYVKTEPNPQAILTPGSVEETPGRPDDKSGRSR